MGHPCWGRICIGGDIPVSLVPEVKKMLDETFHNSCDIVSPFAEGDVFDACDPYARYGHFEELENWLIARRIHFDVYTAADPEWDAGLLQYRGEEVENPDVLAEPGFRSVNSDNFFVWHWAEIKKVLDTVIEAHGGRVPVEELTNLLMLELDAEGAPALKPLRFVEG